MKKAQENYFIHRFEEDLSVDAQENYRLDSTLESYEVKLFSIPNQSCISALIMTNQKQFYFYNLSSNTYEKLDFEPSNGKVPLQIAYLNENLIIRYDSSISIFDLEVQSEVSLNIAAIHIIVGKNKLYVQEENSSTILVFNLKGNALTSVVVEGELLSFDFSNKLHYLHYKNNAVHMDKNLCEHIINKEFLFFSHLRNKHFIIGRREGLFLHTNDLFKNFFSSELSALGSDCKGRVWVLKDSKIYIFTQKSFYEASLDQELIFDSFKEKTLWHQLLIDGKIPEQTSLEVSISDGSINKSYINKKDILLYGFSSEKLTVSLKLLSDSNRTLSPEINSVKIIFDKTPYLDYLPAYYHESPHQIHPFLSIFQSIMGRVELNIDNSAKILDPNYTDESYLAWLSQWLGLIRDFRWPEDRWREFLLQAPELFKKSGTKEGMQDIIEIYSDDRGEIIEYTQADKRFLFCVKLDPDSLSEDSDLEVIKSIVQTFKPAHTKGRVYINQSLKDDTDFIIGESILPFHTQIQ